MMNSRALIATTNPKLTPDKAAASDHVKSNHSKRETQAGKSTGNSFLKVLNLAKEQRAGLKTQASDTKTATLLKNKNRLNVKFDPASRVRPLLTGKTELPERLGTEGHVALRNTGESRLKAKKSTDGKAGEILKQPAGPARDRSSLGDALLAAATPNTESSGLEKKTDRKLTVNAGEQTRDTAKSVSVALARTDKLPDTARIVVIDRRPNETVSELRSLSKTGNRESRNSESVKTEPVRLESGEAKVSETRFTVAETDIDLTSRSEGSSGSRSAAAELARRLDGQAGADIVKQVRIIMSRQDTGDIRINLRPDNLGNVRVRLHLEENRLSGRIFVESVAARDAFRSALDGLQTKLVESGFGAADLELSFDDSGGSFQMNQEKRRNPGTVVEAVRDFESMSATTKTDSAGDGRVNLMA